VGSGFRPNGSRYPNGVEERFFSADRKLFSDRYHVEDFVLTIVTSGPPENVLRLMRALEDLNVPAVIIGRIEQSEEGRRCLSVRTESRLTFSIPFRMNQPSRIRVRGMRRFCTPVTFRTPYRRARGRTRGPRKLRSPSTGDRGILRLSCRICRTHLRGTITTESLRTQ